MEDNVFFSVIIPVYNRADMIGRSINSVLNQSFSNFELIVVDDGSNDETKNIILEFSNRDSRITPVFLPENKGRCYARNAGIEISKGNWICHLDSDDEYYHNHLEFLRKKILEYPNCLAFAVNQHLDYRRNPDDTSSLDKELQYWSIENFIERNPITINQLCYSSQLNLRWSKERMPIAEDLLFIRNLVIRTSILKFSEYTVNMNDHDNRTIETMTPEGVERFVFYNIQSAEKFISGNTIPLRLKNRILSHTYLLCANVFAQGRQKKKTLQLLKKSSKFIPTYFNPLFYKAIVKLLIK